MRTKAAHLLAIAALVGILSSSCRLHSSPAAGPSAVVLVTVEAFRPDLLSLYGGDVETPSLARVAASGLVFTDATTPCPMARPAVSSVMTGLAPDKTGIRDNLNDRLAAATPVLAERFRSAEWKTAAFVGTRFCSHTSGLERGFDLFDGPEGFRVGPGQHFPDLRLGAELADHFKEWLSGLSAQDRFFAWVHIADLHPVAVTGETEEASRKYRETLGSVDRALSFVLGALEEAGRGDGTEVVVAGTHGTLLGEDGKRGDSFWLRKETLSVPLIWGGGRAKRAAARGNRISTAVWLPDVGASLAAACEKPFDPGSDGRDLLGVGRSPRAAPRIAWTWAPDDQFAWPTLTAVKDGGEWKVFDWDAIGRIRGGGAADAAERSALGRPAVPRERVLRAEAVSRLKALGARLGQVPSKAQNRPTDADTVIQGANSVRQKMSGGQAGPGFELLEKLLEKWPENLSLLEHRLCLSSMSGLKRRADASAEKILDLYPDRSEALHWAGHAALLDGKANRADALLEAALSLSPQDADILYDVACVRSRAGDRDGAIRQLAAAVEAGYRNWSWLQRDEDLASLRSDPRYAELLRSHGR